MLHDIAIECYDEVVRGFRQSKGDVGSNKRNFLVLKPIGHNILNGVRGGTRNHLLYLTQPRPLAPAPTY